MEENEDPVYVLTIGEYDNKNTTLRNSIDSPEPILTVPSDGILSCNESRYFWIQWKDRLISKCVKLCLDKTRRSFCVKKGGRFIVRKQLTSFFNPCHFLPIFFLILEFGKGSMVGQEEVLSYTEALPHDISALTMYGFEDEIQYEVRNHESKALRLFISRIAVFC